MQWSTPSSGALTDLLRPPTPSQRRPVFVKQEPRVVDTRPAIVDLPPLLPPRAPFLPGISDVLRTASVTEEPESGRHVPQEYKHEGEFAASHFPQCSDETAHYSAPMVTTYSATFMTRPNATDYYKQSASVLPRLTSPSAYASTATHMTPPGLSRARTRPIGLGMPIRDGTLAGPRPASRTCKFAGCTHYVVDHGLCVRHGGGKRCTTEGCSSRAKHFGRCWRHGGSVECKAPGCPNRAKSRGYCWSHGGGTKCKTVACEKIAISNGLCWAHGGGKRCVVQGCRKQAYERTDNYCNSHYQQFRATAFHSEFS